jgi:hypothetical protein
MPEGEQERFTRILERFSQAKRRNQIEDKILDLAISLEMALLEGTSREQLSLSFRLRGSWFLCDNFTERKRIYDKLRDLYNFRSKVAHCGKLETKEIKVVRDNFDEYSSIVSKIFKKLIDKGKPDWKDLILNDVKTVSPF